MKNAILPTLLLSTLVAATPYHDHAQLHHKRAYKWNTKTVVETTTMMKVVTLTGPLPAGQTAYSPDEAAEIVAQGYGGGHHGGKPPVESPVQSSINYNTVPMGTTAQPPVPSVQPSAPPAVPSAPPAVPSAPPAAPSLPPASTNVGAQPVPSSYVAPAPVPSTPTKAAPTQPAPTYVAPPPATNPPATPANPGTGAANPYFPNGPKVGQTASGVRLSPYKAYWSGESIEGHVGACGKKPYDLNDPILSKSDSKGDKKFMLHPPVISGDEYADIMQYCGAVLEVTGPDGLTTTGTVVDLCEDCGGPGGIDMMKANWLDVFKNVEPGNCVSGASWVLKSWAPIKAYHN